MEDSTKLKWEGRWDQLKGRGRQIWGDLTDDDLDVATGDVEALIGKIKERTGEHEEEIRSQLERSDI